MKDVAFSRPSAASVAPIESLEPRHLMAATPTGPALVGEHLIGPVGAITSIVLQFNTHLDPATATDPKDYAFGRHFSSSSSGSFLSSFFPFSKRKSSGKATPFATAGSVTYDDAAETITLTPKHEFRANIYFRYLRVSGSGKHKLLGADGKAFNSGHSLVTHFRISRNSTLRYTDVAKNRVTVSLTGPGRLVTLLRRGRNPEPIIYLDSTDATSSVLTGTVTAGKNGTGVTSLQEVSGSSIGQINLPSSFVVQFSQ